MKKARLSVVDVDIKVSGKAQYIFQDIKHVYEDDSKSEAAIDSTKELQTRRLEESQVVGKYVMDYDTMISGVILTLISKYN